MKEKKNLYRQGIVFVILLAGCICLRLKYCLGWIPGILFFLAACLWGVMFWKQMNQDVDTLDKKLASGWKEQLDVLFTVLAVAVFLFSGIVLLFRPDFEDVCEQNSFSAFIHVIHRFAGFNYYSDNDKINFGLLIISFFGAFILGGLLITTFSNIVQQKKDDYLSGTKTYRKLKGHIVILGFNDVVRTLCKDILGNSNQRALILTNQKLSKVRSSLKSQLSDAVFNRIIYYSGGISEEDNLKRLNLNDCDGIYILGEQDAPGHDSVCMSALRLICSLLDINRQDPLKVYLQLDSQSAFSIVQRLDIPDSYISRATNDSEDNPAQRKVLIDLRTFNLYENQARLLWGYYKEKEGWELDFSDISGPKLLPDSTKRVNLVIAGFDRMGQALLLEALRICHYPNYVEDNHAVKTLISVVDKDMDKIWPQFVSQYPHLDEIEDIEIKHYTKSIESEEIRALLEGYANDENELLTVAICFWDPDTSFAAGLSLPESLYFTFQNGELYNNEHVRILIRNEYNSGIVDIVSSDSQDISRYKNVRFFGSIEDGLSAQLLDDKAAILQGAFFDTAYKPKAFKAKMDIYNELETTIGELIFSDPDMNKKETYSILNAYRDKKLDGDSVLYWARKFWDVTSENHKCSNRYQIEMYGIFKRYLPCLRNCYTKDCDCLLSQMEHRRWCAERYIMGYAHIAYSKGSSIKQHKDSWRVHNDLIPYSKLDDKEKSKDLVHLTIDTINEILSTIST